MAHLISTELKKQIAWWQLYSVVAPSLFLVISAMAYATNIASLASIFWTGFSILIITCLIWWHWCLFTMINMLSIMKDTDEHFENVTGQLSRLRTLIEPVDNNQIH